MRPRSRSGRTLEGRLRPETRLGVLLTVVLLAAIPRVSGAAGDSLSTARVPLLGRRDLWFALGSAAAVTIAFQSDTDIRREALASTSKSTDDLADFAERFGNPIYLAPAMLLVEGGSHLFHAPGLRAANRRIAGAIVVAGLATQVLKLGTGRARPEHSGNDPYRFRPFSGDDAFPSGHATVAFSAAAAIDRETSAPWVPLVVYPTAALVCWSRVHVDRHWASDVVAGAAVGAWVGHKVTVLEQRSGLDPRRWFGAEVRPWALPARGGLLAGASATF